MISLYYLSSCVKKFVLNCAIVQLHSIYIFLAGRFTWRPFESSEEATPPSLTLFPPSTQLLSFPPNLLSTTAQKTCFFLLLESFNSSKVSALENIKSAIDNIAITSKYQKYQERRQFFMDFCLINSHIKAFLKITERYTK